MFLYRLMYKKRIDITSNKNAQITVFIILGILILFTFLIMMALTSQSKEADLEKSKEIIFSKLFKKEALRIFVEDCLADELERGLIIIGNQGRLSSNQPGGRKKFDEGTTGRNYPPGTKKEIIFYGVTKEIYSVYQQAYPCENDTTPEEFCQYQYPNTEVKFGKQEISKNLIESDLSRFLTNRTQFCVESFAKINISGEAKVESGDLKLKLQIFLDGIAVDIDFPLKLKVGKEEISDLSKFDFFFPSKFGTLLKSAIDFPLDQDTLFIDFNYTEKTLLKSRFTYANKNQFSGCTPFESLNKNYFFCNRALHSDLYHSLSVSMKTEDLSDGDELYIFEAPGIINRPENYQFRFIRQNRPPALDYVGRRSCPQAGYDYLVIRKDLDYGKINLTLFALDPDEDEIKSYQFDDGVKKSKKQNYLSIPLVDGPLKIKAEAFDEHGLSDWQNVRILVDRPMEVNFSLDTEYQIKIPGQLEVLPYLEAMKVIDDEEDYYLISNEDPIFVKLVMPENSLVEGDPKVKLIYTPEEGPAFGQQISYTENSKKKGVCFSYPREQGKNNPYTCDLNTFEKNFKNWDKAMKLELSPFQELGKGKLNLSFSMNYCLTDFLGKFKTADIIVKECIPHVNLEHPYAYPYEKYKFIAKDGKMVLDGFESINPFLAQHSCCNVEFDFITKDDKDNPCFINPEPGCYGQVESEKFKGTPYTALEKGLIWETQIRLCKGDSGNKCEGSFKNKLYQEVLWCGIPGKNECKGGVTGIKEICQNGKAFRFINDKENQGWCYGAMGCQDFCKAPNAVVYTGNSDNPEDIDMNILAKEKELVSHKDIGFKCGCLSGSKNKGFDDGRLCDANFDGSFKGVCKQGKCEDVS